MGCLYCEKNEKMQSFTYPVCELSTSDLYLNREQSYPGRCILVLRRHAEEFCELTKEERAAIAQKIAEITAAVQAEADKIDAAIAEEYKAAFNRLCLDIVNLIPESIRNTADTYFKEFNTLVDSLKAATDGKEPLPAAHAAQEALEANAARVLITMKNDLTKEEVQTVEEAIQKLNDKLAEAEKQWKDAIAKAEEEAKAYLESLKTARTEKTT